MERRVEIKRVREGPKQGRGGVFQGIYSKTITASPHDAKLN